MQLPEGLQFMLHSTADSQEEGSHALSRGSMWAGASHWRYQQPASRVDSDSQADSKPVRSKRYLAQSAGRNLSRLMSTNNEHT